MTSLLIYAKRQAAETIHSPRRLNVLFVLMVAIALVGVALAMQKVPQTITYPQRFLTATPAVVCPGDSFTYPVSIVVDDGDAVSRITEGWCNSYGICPKVLQDPVVYLNFLVAQNVTATATRTAPNELTPGEWQLRHCNETHSDGLIDVVCYQVAVTVKDCQVEP
jgi:hypothetical protein